MKNFEIKAYFKASGMWGIKMIKRILKKVFIPALVAICWVVYAVFMSNNMPFDTYGIAIVFGWMAAVMWVVVFIQRLISSIHDEKVIAKYRRKNNT